MLPEGEAEVSETRSRPPRGAGTIAPDGKPTLRTIAQMTGFATTTISRALNNAPELSVETRELVQKIAAEVGYVRDRTALRLKTGRTHVISLVLDPHDEILGFGKSMVSGLIDAIAGTPYHLVITPISPRRDPLDPILYILRNKAADGVIFSRTEPDDARVKLLTAEGLAFVSHGRTELPTPHPYVDYDNEAFAYLAAKRLVAKGAQRLSIILPPERFNFGHHLRKGFERAVAETGVSHEVLPGATLDAPAEQIRSATVARLNAPNPPDGLICTGDAAALAMMAGIADSGRIIGRDVDVVVKQTSGVFSLVRPKVDAIYEDTALAGRQMGDLLLRRIAGEPPETLQILHQPEISF